LEFTAAFSKNYFLPYLSIPDSFIPVNARQQLLDGCEELTQLKLFLVYSEQLCPFTNRHPLDYVTVMSIY
jgi:hypothetical protein